MARLFLTLGLISLLVGCGTPTVRRPSPHCRVVSPPPSVEQVDTPSGTTRNYISGRGITQILTIPVFPAEDVSFVLGTAYPGHVPVGPISEVMVIVVMARPSGLVPYEVTGGLVNDTHVVPLRLINLPMEGFPFVLYRARMSVREGTWIFAGGNPKLVLLSRELLFSQSQVTALRSFFRFIIVLR